MRLVLDGSEACAELVTECNGKKQVVQKIIVSTSGIRESLATPLQCDGLVDPQSGQPYHAMGCTVFSYPVIHYALRMSLILVPRILLFSLDVMVGVKILNTKHNVVEP